MYKNWIVLFSCFLSIIKAEISGELKVCALMVSFQSDDKESTTGNGRFLDEIEGIDFMKMLESSFLESKIVIARDQNLETTKTQSLFIENNVFIHYSNNKKDIDKFMKMNDKVIIISNFLLY